MSPISKLSRFQPLKPDHTNTPDASNPQQLLPPHYFTRTLPPLDPAASRNNNFESISGSEERNLPPRCRTSTTPTTTPQTPPTAIVRPLSIEIPKTTTHHFKSKQHFINYYKHLISYNNLLKQKEIYLNTMLINCHSQALCINNSPQSTSMCSNNCSINFCNNVLCINNFQMTPHTNNPDPNIIIDPPIVQNPPACEVSNNISVFNVCNIRQPLNDLDPDPPIIIKQEPASPDISTLHISDPPATSPNPPFIADFHPDKYPLFHISPLTDDLSPIPPSFEI